jgi:hypothetical protein
MREHYPGHEGQKHAAEDRADDRRELEREPVVRKSARTIGEKPPAREHTRAHASADEGAREEETNRRAYDALYSSAWHLELRRSSDAT